MKRPELQPQVQIAARWQGLDEAVTKNLLLCLDRVAMAYGVPSSRLRLSDRFSDLSEALNCGGFADGEEEVEAILRENGLPNLSASDRLETLLQSMIDAHLASTGRCSR